MFKRNQHQILYLILISVTFSLLTFSLMRTPTATNATIAQKLDLPNDTTKPVVQGNMEKDHLVDIRNNFNHNSQVYDGEFNYRSRAIPNEFTLPLPSASQNSKRSSSNSKNQEQKQPMVVIVLSARANFERRQTIRETWGEGHGNIFFIIGGADDGESLSSRRREFQMLRKEQEKYGDLVDSIHKDTYHSLPYKLKFGLTFVIRRLSPEFQWIVKVDDDTVVRVDTLYRYFLKKYNPNLPMVVGDIIQNAPVQRDGKWMEDPIYKPSVYPYWPKGSCGYVVSRPIAQYIASQDDLYYYQGEDTSLGIWLDEAQKVNSTALSNENATNSITHITWVSSSSFTNNGLCADLQNVVIGHQITPSHMRECYAKGLRDEVSHDKVVWTEYKRQPDYVAFRR